MNETLVDEILGALKTVIPVGFTEAAKVHLKYRFDDRIFIEWSTADVFDAVCGLGYVDGFSEKMAFRVLQQVKRRHDCEIGVNWTVIEQAIKEIANENGLKPQVKDDDEE